KTRVRMPLDLNSIFYLKERNGESLAGFGAIAPLSRRDAACRVFRAPASARPSETKQAPSLSQLLEEQTNRFNPAMKIRNVKFLVRSMQVVVGKPKAHHDRWNLQHVLEIGDDRNRPSRANEHGFFFESVMQSLSRRLDEPV